MHTENFVIAYLIVEQQLTIYCVRIIHCVISFGTQLPQNRVLRTLHLDAVYLLGGFHAPLGGMESD